MRLKILRPTNAEGKENEAFLVIRVFSEGEQSFEQFLAGFFGRIEGSGGLTA